MVFVVCLFWLAVGVVCCLRCGSCSGVCVVYVLLFVVVWLFNVFFHCSLYCVTMCCCCIMLIGVVRCVLQVARCMFCALLVACWLLAVVC